MMSRRYRRYLIVPCRVLVILLIILICYITLKQSENYYKINRKVPWKEYSDPYNRSKVATLITYLNSEEKIQNTNAFGITNENTVVIVVLLDTFSTEIIYFINSLSQIRGIEEALIIFSHAYFDIELKTLIQRIDFCKVLQIFYPYSVQMHPQAFPGRNPEDCPFNMNVDTAKAMNCVSASFPDFRAHYRDPLKAQMKHHWWWTTNQVFEKLRCTRKHADNVIFLEDKFLFTSDFIYMALRMKNIAASVPGCDFIAMGTDSALRMDHDNVYSAELTTFEPKIHSSVLAFGITTWNIIAAHYDLFCQVDDASWSRSLQYISFNRKGGSRFNVMYSVTPRAYKMNTCNGGCDATVDIDKLARFEEKYEADLFPPHVELYIHLEIVDGEDFVFDYRESDGGWADPRDVALCRNMTYSKIKKILMEIENVITEYSYV